MPAELLGYFLAGCGRFPLIYIRIPLFVRGCKSWRLRIVRGLCALSRERNGLPLALPSVFRWHVWWDADCNAPYNLMRVLTCADRTAASSVRECFMSSYSQLLLVAPGHALLEEAHYDRGGWAILFFEAPPSQGELAFCASPEELTSRTKKLFAFCSDEEQNSRVKATKKTTLTALRINSAKHKVTGDSSDTQSTLSELHYG